MPRGETAAHFDCMNKYVTEIEHPPATVSAENINILGELIINISHCFYVSNQTEKPYKIYSHSQALAQCGEFLKNHSDANLIPVESTSQAIENIIKEKNCGAIASKICGEIHNIKPIKENINDNPLNQTRFFLISSNINKSFTFLENFLKKTSPTQIGRARVGKECRSRWSPYH